MCRALQGSDEEQDSPGAQHAGEQPGRRGLDCARHRGHTDAGLTFLALGLRRAPKRADQLKLTGIELASVAETIGLGAAPGGWSTIKMLQVFHDGATVGGGGGGGASSKTLSEAVSKPISWTSATVHLTNEKYEAATGTLVAGDTYIIIVTLYDDWGGTQFTCFTCTKVLALLVLCSSAAQPAPLPSLALQPEATQFTCFTGTKVLALLVQKYLLS